LRGFVWPASPPPSMVSRVCSLFPGKGRSGRVLPLRFFFGRSGLFSRTSTQIFRSLRWASWFPPSLFSFLLSLFVLPDFVTLVRHTVARTLYLGPFSFFTNSLVFWPTTSLFLPLTPGVLAYFREQTLPLFFPPPPLVLSLFYRHFSVQSASSPSFLPPPGIWGPFSHRPTVPTAPTWLKPPMPRTPTFLVPMPLGTLSPGLLPLHCLTG